MLKQNIMTNTTANEMLVELSDAEQEASKGGGIWGAGESEQTILSMPAFPSMPVGMYGTPNVSCPACSSGMNPNYNGPTPMPMQVNV